MGMQQRSPPNGNGYGFAVSYLTSFVGIFSLGGGKKLAAAPPYFI